MRKIKFRGKRVDNGGWIKGPGIHLLFGGGAVWIMSLDDHREVDPETVGQFTGLHDKTGKEIYEGDIVRDEYGQVNEIKFHYGSFWFNWLEMPHYMDQVEKGEIIGNIHENPELVEAP